MRKTNAITIGGHRRAANYNSHARRTRAEIDKDMTGDKRSMKLNRHYQLSDQSSVLQHNSSGIG